MASIIPLEDYYMGVREDAPQNPPPQPASTTQDNTQKPVTSLWARLTGKAEPRASPGVQTASTQSTKAPNETATAPAREHLGTQAEGSS